MSGPKIAALYGLKPHTLGLCGPKEALRQQTLRKFLLGRVSANKIEKILKQFKGAYPYYKLIAKSNKIKNPFGQKVIKAYWIGNKLLDKVKIGDLRQMIIKEFSGPGLLPKKIAIQKAMAIPENSKPHHSFHVLTIGSVTGSVDFKNTRLKDVCRVGWGKVTQRVIPARFARAPAILAESRRARRAEAGIQVKKSGSRIKSGMTNLVGKVTVEYQSLTRKKKIKLGKPIKKEILWDKEILPKIKTGDWVSFHWDSIAQVLTKDDVKNLRKYTLNSLK